MLISTWIDELKTEIIEKNENIYNSFNFEIFVIVIE